MVALRKESVDRNRSPIKCAICRIVALRKESVDRNISLNSITYADPLSLSARRAWIEIGTLAAQNLYTMVALRKESVDRNP